jgi:hypothetical protein
MQRQPSKNSAAIGLPIEHETRWSQKLVDSSGASALA